MTSRSLRSLSAITTLMLVHLGLSFSKVSNIHHMLVVSSDAIIDKAIILLCPLESSHNIKNTGNPKFKFKCGI